MYLRRFERQTRAKRDTVVQDAIDFFGREKIMQAIDEEKNTPICAVFSLNNICETEI